MKADGISRAAALLTSAYSSYSGCRQYREDLADAVAGVPGAPQVDRLRAYFNHPGFIEPMVDATLAALADLPEEARRGGHLAFVTHSIPQAMNERSGPRGGAYVAQHRVVAAEIVERVREETGHRYPSELVFCSRSGPPQVPWLEPDVNDHLRMLQRRGVPGVAVVPIGFVSDHMEVVYDLDTEARETARGDRSPLRAGGDCRGGPAVRGDGPRPPPRAGSRRARRAGRHGPRPPRRLPGTCAPRAAAPTRTGPGLPCAAGTEPCRTRSWPRAACSTSRWPPPGRRGSSRPGCAPAASTSPGSSPVPPTSSPRPTARARSSSGSDCSVARPEDGFFGEEGHDEPGTSGVRWIVDPIDGTVNYLYGLPHYAVSVAAEQGGRVVAGAVVAPVLGLEYAAALGGGATLNGVPLARRESPPLAEALVGTGFSYERDIRAHQAEAVARLLPQVRDIRRIGSCALDLCALAAGSLDAYVEEGPHLWDHAAGGLVATECGARIDVRPTPRGMDLVVCAPELLWSPFEALVSTCGFV